MPLINVKLIEGVFSSDQKQRDHRAPDRRDGLDRGREHAPGHVVRGRGGQERRLGHRRQRAHDRAGPRARRGRGLTPGLRGPAGARRVPAGPRRGCSLGGMHELLAQALGDGLLDEVVELTRDLIRADTTNPPGNETLGVEVLEAYLRAQRRASPSASRATPRAPTSSPGCAAAARARRSRSPATRTSSTRIPRTGASPPFARRGARRPPLGARGARHEGPDGGQRRRARRARAQRLGAERRRPADRRGRRGGRRRRASA